LFIYREDDPRWSELIEIYDGDERVSGIRVEDWGYFPNKGNPWSVRGIQFVVPAGIGKQAPTYFILNGPVPVVHLDGGYVQIANA